MFKVLREVGVCFGAFVAGGCAPRDVICGVVGGDPETEGGAGFAEVLPERTKGLHPVWEEAFRGLPDGASILPAVVRNHRIDADAAPREWLLEGGEGFIEVVSSDIFAIRVKPVVVVGEGACVACGAAVAKDGLFGGCAFVNGYTRDGLALYDKALPVCVGLWDWKVEGAYEAGCWFCFLVCAGVVDIAVVPDAFKAMGVSGGLVAIRVAREHRGVLGQQHNAIADDDWFAASAAGDLFGCCKAFDFDVEGCGGCLE